ncbi:piggyBac transposable element-derived protein 4-like [Photinus pyralis]|uniref:piggyBac transposable element-derived protein 4-like n=1 Tax=Photinus pyralis TaxID=7054 RepID=UPI0012676411|nr:piggyBac transposable element-derived protein 4-like [Photinus pyralis]XP_031335191.1 piggyBac transposable element-derived protein 4-like [Photinus pyralis]
MPGPDLTIDEQLVAFRGRCPFRQYIPSKPAKYGLKVFVLVDSSNMYTLNLEIYAGTQPGGPFQLSNSPSDVVKRLVSFIRGTYRNITMDNWFSSFPLAVQLKNEFKLTMLGTVKKNKREIPAEFINTAERPALSSQFAFHNECTLVSFVPRKKKNVLVLSTSHADDSIDHETGKPTMVVDYNHTKFGVDVVDQMCASYNVARNSRRWPLTIFFDMNIAAINALVLFQMNNSNLTHKRRDFLRTLALDLMKPQIRKRSGIPNISTQLRERCCLLVTERLEESSTSANNIASPSKKARTGNGRCYICPRKRDKRTRDYCSICNNWICKDHQNDSPIVCLKCEEKEDE